MQGKSAERFSATDKRKAVLREIGFREHVYPERIRSGRMSPSEARWQIAIFRAIAEDYAKLEERERLL